MSHMRYNRINVYGRRSSSSYGMKGAGFRINSKRFSVRGLRSRFVYLFKLLSLSRWGFSYGRQALKSLKKGGSSIIKRNNSSSSRTSFVRDQKTTSFGRSNSFYADAIADCLDFIKRSSISVDQNPAVYLESQS